MSAYPGAIDAVIDPAELVHGRPHHGVDTFFIDNVDLDGDGAEFRVLGELLAFFHNLLGAIVVEIREDQTAGSSLGEGERCLFADACCSLYIPISTLRLLEL